jgi:hypothetical protein
VEIFPIQNARPFAEDIKMAEPGSKTFRSAQLKIKGGTKVVQYSKVLPLIFTYIFIR